MLGDFPAVAVRHDRAAEIAACGVFNVVADRQRELVGHEAFFKQVHCDGLCHFAHDEARFIVRIRTLQNLPGADTVCLRPVRFDVFHPAWFPAPCMVDEELSVDAEHLVEQLFVVIFARLADGAFCNVAHRVDTDGLELFGVAAPDAPKVRQRTVRPELPAVAHFVKLRDADAIFIRRDVLRHDVHGDLAEVEIRSDARRGRDARGVQHIEDHGLCQLMGGHVIRLEVAGHIHHHFIDGVDVDVLGRDVFEIDVVDLRADLNVFRHLRRRDKITHRARRVSCQLISVAALFKKIAACFAPTFGVDFLDALDHFKEPCSAGNTVCLQRRRYRETNGFLRAAKICYDQIGRHRVKAALHALDRRIIRF